MVSYCLHQSNLNNNHFKVKLGIGCTTSKVVKMLNFPNFTRSSDIAIDLGTSKIAIFVRDEGLVIEEAACVAFRGVERRKENIVAFGDLAASIAGREPRGITVVKPIRDGVINDTRVASLLLSLLLEKAGIGRSFARARVLVGALYGANTIERRAFEQVVNLGGGRRVRLVAEPFAAAIGASLLIDEPRASMVVDIGGGATEAIVVSLSQIVCGNSIRIGGDSMSNSIADLLQAKFGFAIGTLEASRLYKAVSEATDMTAEIRIRGFDLQANAPSTLSIPISELQNALRGSINTITAMVKNVIDSLTPELSADLIGDGITLTGGCSGNLALRQNIERVTQIAVKSIAAPQRAVIHGAGKMLEYYRYIA